MEGFQHPPTNWSLNSNQQAPPPPSSSYQPATYNSRAVENAANFLFNMQNLPFSLPGLDLAGGPLPVTTQDPNPAPDEEYDDDAEFYGVSSMQARHATYNPFQPEQASGVHFNPQADVVPVEAQQERSRYIDTRGGYLNDTNAPDAEAQVFQLPGLGGLHQAEADDMPTPLNQVESRTSPPPTASAGQIEPQALLTQLLRPQDQTAETEEPVMAIASDRRKSQEPNSPAGNIVPGADAAHPAPTNRYDAQHYRVQHDRALATIKFLHSLGVSYRDVSGLGIFDESEEPHLIELYREASLLPTINGPSIPTPAFGGTTPRAAEQSEPEMQSRASPEDIPPEERSSVWTNRTIKPTQEASPTLPLPAAAVSGSAQPQGREAYLAKLKAVRAKKVAVSSDNTTASARNEAAKTNEYSTSVATTQPPPPTSSTTLSEPTPANITEATGDAMKISPSNEPVKLKSGDVASRVKQRVAELKMQMASRMAGQAPVASGPAGLVPADGATVTPASEPFVKGQADTAPNSNAIPTTRNTGTEPAFPTSTSHMATQPSSAQVVQPVMLSTTELFDVTSFEQTPVQSDNTATLPSMTSNGFYGNEGGQNGTAGGLDIAHRHHVGQLVLAPNEAGEDSGSEMEVDGNDNEASKPTDAVSSSMAVSLPQKSNSPSFSHPNGSPQPTNGPAPAAQPPAASTTPGPVPANKARIKEQQAKLAAKIAAERAALAELERKRNAKKQPPTPPPAPTVKPAPIDQKSPPASNISSAAAEPPQAADANQVVSESAPNNTPALPNGSHAVPEQLTTSSDPQPTLPSLHDLTSQTSPGTRHEDTRIAQAANEASKDAVDISTTPDHREPTSKPLVPTGTQPFHIRTTETEDLRKKRRAEMTELDLRLSEKRRKLEEQQQAMMLLQAEIEAADQERENLARDVEALGIDTDGMTREQLIETKENLESSQQGAGIHAEATVEPGFTSAEPKSSGQGSSQSGQVQSSAAYKQPVATESSQVPPAILSAAVTEPTPSEGLQLGQQIGIGEAPLEHELAPSEHAPWNRGAEPDATYRAQGMDSKAGSQMVPEPESIALNTAVDSIHSLDQPATESALLAESMETQQPASGLGHDEIGHLDGIQGSAAVAGVDGMEAVPGIDSTGAGETFPAEPSDNVRWPRAMEQITNNVPSEEGEIDQIVDLAPASNGASVPRDVEEMSMTDDSMSVSSGEAPDSSGVLSETVPTLAEAQPSAFNPASMAKGSANDYAPPDSQARPPISLPLIPAAPSRFYNPRDRRVLGLTDEAESSTVEPVTARDYAGVNLIGQVGGELHPFEEYKSPLKRFKDFRYHQQFKESASQGFQSPTWSHNLNADLPLCLFELQNGVCNDYSCSYQHFRDIGLKHSQLLLQLGQKAPRTGPEEQQKWKVGLSRLISDMRTRNEQDVEKISEAIVEFRRNFLREDNTEEGVDV